MHKIVRMLFVQTVLLTVFSCETKSDSKKTESNIKLRFVDEFVLPDNTTFENTSVGGLSGINNVRVIVV